MEISGEDIINYIERLKAENAELRYRLDIVRVALEVEWKDDKARPAATAAPKAPQKKPAKKKPATPGVSSGAPQAGSRADAALLYLVRRGSMRPAEMGQLLGVTATKANCTLHDLLTRFPRLVERPSQGVYAATDAARALYPEEPAPKKAAPSTPEPAPAPVAERPSPAASLSECAKDLRYEMERAEGSMTTSQLAVVSGWPVADVIKALEELDVEKIPERGRHPTYRLRRDAA